MNEVIWRKKGSKRRTLIIIYCFNNTRDRPDERTQKEVEYWINDKMIEEGWRKE